MNPALARVLLPGLALIVAGIGAAAAWLVLQARKEEERNAAFAAVAARLGWDYRRTDDALRKELGLPIGWGFRWYRNFSRGRAEGTEFLLYDDIFAQKNVGKIVRTFAAFRWPGPAPEFGVLPNKMETFLARRFGWPAVDLGTDAAFSEAYVVEGRDPAVAGLFGGAVRERLLSRPGWTAQSEGGWLLLYAGGPTPPEGLEDFQREACRTAALFLRARPGA